jgi:hypothetical protein
VKETVLAQLTALKAAPTAALKARWRELFDTEPPAYNRRFLEAGWPTASRNWPMAA